MYPQVRQYGDDRNDVVRYIERSLWWNVLTREDDSLIDIEIQVIIFFGDGLKFNQDLKGRVTDSLALMYPSSVYSIARAPGT